MKKKRKESKGNSSPSILFGLRKEGKENHYALVSYVFVYSLKVKFINISSVFFLKKNFKIFFINFGVPSLDFHPLLDKKIY